MDITVVGQSSLFTYILQNFQPHTIDSYESTHKF